MMRKLFFVLFAAITALNITAQDQFVNLTPRPKEITVGTGVWTMPQTMTVATGQLAEDIVAEAEKFAEVLRTATGRTVNVEPKSTGNVVLRTASKSEVPNEEGYILNVTTSGVVVRASTTAGFFYGLQSLKKIMPANVMAGVYDPKVTEYTAPVCKITDEPRFEYRGFMLDVSRHFFDIEQVKRMLDVMAYYKLNKFHWHLTDDQGWRIQIKKYPKLTTVGATRDYSWEVDPVYGGYNTLEPYGPYFYTQEQAKEVVEYAAKLHIEVIPEVDMPGHFMAAMAAYPEFSCTPNGNHYVWCQGGISSDVMNVANPQAVQFTKDIITELAEIFPSKHFHIGGDECPTGAWEGNSECQALWKSLGSPKLSNGKNNYRILQSNFIKQMDEHAKSLGKHLFMWNESISADGADQEIVQNTDATIMCWTGPYAAASTATKRGLKCIITPWGPYYINRVQSKDPGEPVGAGNGDDTAQRTYNEVPVPANVPADLQPLYIGVQGTFWCEHVGSRYLLEYLALPRLICVAEAGWTPQELKNWENFRQRWNKDAKMLDYRGYYYGRHFLDKEDEGSSNSKVMPKEGEYYRIVTTATDASRRGACIEVLPEGSSKIGTGNAQAYRLWQMPQADEGASNYNYQWFTFELDPNGSGFYAMVCRALPNGSVNPTPTAQNNQGRFDYDRTTKHYAWKLNTDSYTPTANGNSRGTLQSKNQPSNMYVNAAAGGQNFSVNQWSDPTDGNGGIWEFFPATVEVVEQIEAPWPAEGTVVRIENNVKPGILLCDSETNNLQNTTDRLTSNAWVIENYGEVSADGTSRTVQLRNYLSSRYIANTGSTPVSMSGKAADVTLAWDATNECWNIGGGIVPIAHNYKSNPGCVAAGGVYPMGAGWKMTPVTPITLNCTDTEGTILASYNSSLAVDEELTADVLPAIKNCTVKEISSNDNAYFAVYERSAYSVLYRGETAKGIIVIDQETTVPVGEQFTVAWPEYEFGTQSETETPDGTVISLVNDLTLTATYEPNEGAVFGFKAVGEAADKVEPTKSYLIYDTMPTDASRTGYLHTTDANDLVLTRGIESGDPSYVWNAYGSTNATKFYNQLGLYIPTMQRGANMTAITTSTGVGNHVCTRNADGTFKIRNTQNSYYWNANAGGGFTGWDDGHPYMFYKLVGQPYFYVTVVEVTLDTDNTELNKTTSSQLVLGGTDQSALAAGFEPREGYTLTIENKEELGKVTRALTVTATYKKNLPDAIAAPQGEAQQGKVYDLSGREADTQSKGVKIVNGQKVSF